MPWLIGWGARLTPFLYGWFSNDLGDWVTSLNPVNDDDKKALQGWGLASLIPLAVLAYGGYQLYRKYIK